MEQEFQQSAAQSQLALEPVTEVDPFASNSQSFFWAQEADTFVGVGSNGGAVRPSPGFAASPVIIQIDRSTADNNYNSNLVVNFTLSGTASNSVDYVLRDQVTGNLLINNSIVFPTNQSQFLIELDPATNLICISNLTATLTLAASPNYLIDQTSYYAGYPAVNIGIAPNVFSLIANNVSTPTGMDYHPPTQSLIISTETNNLWSFKRIDTNGVISAWSGLNFSSTGDYEIKLATVKSTVNGFTNGAMFFDNGESGIGWLSPDGTVSNLTWLACSGNPFYGLYVDQSGCFGTNLIALRYESGSVWLVNSAGLVVTNYTGLVTSGQEGVISLANNVAQYGPLAGTITDGLDAVHTNGAVTSAMGIVAEDCDLIPSNQDLYCNDDDDGYVLKVSRDVFTNNVGDILITDSGFYDSVAALYIMHWDADSGTFIKTEISCPNINAFEHVSFALIDIPPKTTP